ncbi:MAG: sulfotransferase [Humibacillus sp.]|nr:sulfotransferase [Humibacillus sp.]
MSPFESPTSSSTQTTARRSRSPILVTGMPRSGTTWLARQLAYSQGTALTGREPMNPRGNQYGLGHTLPGWSRLTSPTPKQRRLLRLAYRGLLPSVYSRYGLRQWAAPLPWTRIVVKDPFAVLSVPAVVEATAATVVLVYRHPGAILSSYRRMGWTPDLAEIATILPVGPPCPDLDEVDPVVDEMGRFWDALHRAALEDVAATPGVLVVSHEDLASGGTEALARLTAACDLTPKTQPAAPSRSAASATDASENTGASETRLHNFNRKPTEVAHAWRTRVTDAEVAVLEHHAAATLETLDRVKMPLLT